MRKISFRSVFIALLAALLALAGMFTGPASAAPSNSWADYRSDSFTGGDGSPTTPYLISTPEQLAYMAYLVNTNDTYWDKDYKLTANIDLGAHYWRPIGVYDPYNYSTLPSLNRKFKGVFDGDGHTISSVSINNDVLYPTIYAGLFSLVDGGTVKNVIVSCAINVTKDVVGGVAGRVINNGSVESCGSTGTVSGGDTVGGVVGSVGGGSVKQSYSFCAVSGVQRVGGVVGQVASSGSVENCYSTGTVNGSTGMVGGVAGLVTGSGSVKYSYSTGTVSGGVGIFASVGGVVGGLALTGPSVTNTAALNPSISTSGSSGVHRVIGDDSSSGVSIANNMAFSGMILPSWWVNNPTYDGANMSGTQAATAAFWQVPPLSWSPLVWTFANDKLPVLQGVGGSQLGAIPAHLQITAPGAPTNVVATAGNGQATVSFTPPSSNGGSPITGYTVTASPSGATASDTSSPITVTGLTNGTAYTFTVRATNGAGTGSASAPSSAATPSVAGYTVTFNSQSGSAVSPLANVASGSKIAKPADPTRAGYTFVGWYREAAGTTAWNFDGDTVTANITLYAKWQSTGSGGDGSGNSGNSGGGGCDAGAFGLLATVCALVSRKTRRK
jgi:uncharacterized repeat protein (TIGR02543 family)